MAKSRIETMRADPGTFLYYPLDYVARPARENDIGLDEWGICECDGYYWLGGRSADKGKDVLKVSVLDALEQRDERYAGYGDEEILLFVGRDGTSGKFQWFLRSRAELKDRSQWETRH